MAKYCNCEKFYDSVSFVKGAHIKFRRLPVRLMKELKLLVDEDYTIKDIIFKLNTLGEIQVVIELNQLPGVYFNPSDLTVRSIKELDKIKKDDYNTLHRLIENCNQLLERNAYLESLVNNSLRGNF